MAKICKVQRNIPSLPSKKKVAAYARVSKDSERLLHSLSAQISYYSSYIQSNPEWIYVGVYSDEGITGTIKEKRSGFNKLIEDCDAGKIDMVIVKSISRFARNTVDLLDTVRHLRDIGVAVFFEREQINSLSGDGELMLTLLASFAQEESHSMSDNIKWSYQKKYEKGMPHFRFRILGYKWEGTKMVIDEDEAKIVKRIYSDYLNGMTVDNMVETYKREGIKTINNVDFRPGTLHKILHNVTYTGNLLCQKTYITDPITKKSKPNNGELPQYYIENSHPAIIDMGTFESVNVEMERRHIFFGEWRNNSNYGHYVFSGKIKCGCCGSSFNRRKRRLNQDGSRTIHWVCRSVVNQKGCTNGRALPDKVLIRECCGVLGLNEFDEEEFIARVEKIVVPSVHNLEFHMKNGEIIKRTWVSNARHEGWNEVRRENYARTRHATKVSKSAFEELIVCENCGKPLQQYRENFRAGRVNYWRCITKDEKCKTDGIREDFLKQVLVEVLEMHDFDKDVLKERVERMSFNKSRFLTIWKKDGGKIRIRLGGKSSGYSYEDTSNSE